MVKDIDVVVYIVGFGLVGVLLVGVIVGCFLVFVWDVLVIFVYYMEGYLLVLMLEDNLLEFLFVVLFVFGGYMQLISVIGIGQYELFGEFIDDVVGEVFDKIVKLLGLDYFGGLLLLKMVVQGIVGCFVFLCLMIDCLGLDFSFFGLKIFVVNIICDNGIDDQMCVDIVCVFEDVVVDMLMIKCKWVLDQMGFK